MVISDKYKYVFVELPRTGTTAISKELVELYGGKKILWKHAPLNKFLKHATKEQKSYYTKSLVKVSEEKKCALFSIQMELEQN